MAASSRPDCTDCVELDRRGFLGTLGVGALAAGLAPAVLRAEEAAKTAKVARTKPAEDLVRELFATLSAESERLSGSMLRSGVLSAP